MLSLRTNAASLNAQKSLASNQMALSDSMAKLSSGFRITKASDDAAGLGVSAGLTAQVASYQQASRNANDGLSVTQTAEAALNETTNILTRMRELAMQSSSDGISNTQRADVQKETDALAGELDRINATTEFNGTTLFGAAAPLTFQVGIRATANDFLTVDTTGMHTDSASLGNGTNTIADMKTGGAIDLATSATQSRGALAVIDAAIDAVSGDRATLGAVANRLTSVLSTISQASESASEANSRIRDVDVAEETANMSRSQILVQAGVSVLAQANQQPQIALKLLGG
ncbi:MAG TPA: flagellin [Myxococcota bacterium]|jgi:flagellin